MRLIATRLLPDGYGGTYVQGELSGRAVTPLRPPRKMFHLYCSPHNAGAAELIAELSSWRSGVGR